MLACRLLRSKVAILWVASVVLAACASGPRRAAREELRLDTETAGKLRHAAAAGRAARAVAPSATRAMWLGQQKHALALQCVRNVLKRLWPAPFSIEQRSRYYPNARVVETVSRQEEARLIAEGCTSELWRTIKPDIVLHADDNLLRSVLTLDLKFPCPSTNQPQWKQYGASSAYAGFDQGKVYKDALGGEALILSPVKKLGQ